MINNQQISIWSHTWVAKMHMCTNCIIIICVQLGPSLLINNNIRAVQSHCAVCTLQRISSTHKCGMLMHLVTHVSVFVSVCLLSSFSDFQSIDLETSFQVYEYMFRICGSSLYIKSMGNSHSQDHSSKKFVCVFHLGSN